MSNAPVRPVVLGAASALLVSAAVLTLSRCGAQTDSDGKETIKNLESGAVSVQGAEIGIGSGSKIAVPPGAVAVGTEISVQKVVQPPEFATLPVEVGSAPVEIVATGADGTAVERASVPMTVDLALEAASLALAPATTADNLCVVLKTRAGKLYVWRRAALAKVDEAAKLVAVSTVFFGTFQAVYCGQEALAGYEDAVTTGASGAPQASVSMTIKPTFRGDLGYQKACLGVVRLDTRTDCQDCGSQVVTIGFAEGSVTSEATVKATYAPTDVVDGKEYYVVAVLQTAGGACPFKLGEDFAADGKTLGDPRAFLAFPADLAALRAGSVAGVLGEAGAYALTSVKLQIEDYDGKFPATDEPKVCLDTDLQKGGRAMIPVAFAGGLVGGSPVYEALVARGASAATDPVEMAVRFGDACNTLGDAETDPATGRPYEIRLQGDGSASLAVVATTLEIQNQVGLGGNVCLRLAPKGLGETDGERSGELLVSLSGTTYPVYLPALREAAYVEDGLPVFDIGVDLKGTGDCRDATSGQLKPPPLKNKRLAKPIPIEVKFP